MSQYGISGANVPATLRYSGPINFAAVHYSSFPMLAYAIAYRETIHGEVVGLWPNASTVVSGDGGYGLFQITLPPIPEAWADAYTNACDAIKRFIEPAVTFWATTYGYEGTTLVRCVAAEFNAGRGNAEAGHAQGNVGLYTTNDYPDGVEAYYSALVAGTDLEAVAS